MTTLAELRSYVRTQTQTTESELPDATVDLYLSQAFDRTVSFENNWPHLEQTWEPTQAAGSETMDLPANAWQQGIVGLFDGETGYRIEMVDHAIAEQRYAYIIVSTSLTPYPEFSIWGGKIYFWPRRTFDSDRSYRLTGYRKAAQPDFTSPASAPDLDERLHMALGNYAIAMAYEQQEDEVLGSQYMQRWMQDVQRVATSLMEPARDRPLKMGPRVIIPAGRRRGGFLGPIVASINTPGS